MIDFNRVFELSKWLDNLLRSERKGFSFLAPSDIQRPRRIRLCSDSQAISRKGCIRINFRAITLHPKSRMLLCTSTA